MEATTLLIPCTDKTLNLSIDPPHQLSVSNPISPSRNGDTEIPPHLSHDPANNLKRSDPFKFGSRYLEPSSNIYEFNAWDHVTPTPSHYEWAETQYAAQRASPVSDFDKARFNNEPEKWWNKFYSNNTSNFFKDRKWLHQEFPILSELTRRSAGERVILEVGAGAGNTAFPILKLNENPGLMVHACDFSSRAVELMKGNEAYDEERMRATVWDVSGENLPDGVEEGSVDVVLLVFVFSALSPLQWYAAIRNVWRALKPGGSVCFRDYGKGDLTQVRFKKGRLLEDNFYIRGDGTRVYFFGEDELRRIWGGQLKEPEFTTKNDDEPPRNMSESKTATNEADCRTGQGSLAEIYTEIKAEAATRAESDPEQDPKIDPGEMRGTLDSERAFDIVSLGVDRRMLVNRQKQLKMYRCWMQGCFRKPI